MIEYNFLLELFEIRIFRLGYILLLLLLIAWMYEFQKLSINCLHEVLALKVICDVKIT